MIAPEEELQPLPPDGWIDFRPAGQVIDVNQRKIEWHEMAYGGKLQLNIADLIALLNDSEIPWHLTIRSLSVGFQNRSAVMGTFSKNGEATALKVAGQAPKKPSSETEIDDDIDQAIVMLPSTALADFVQDTQHLNVSDSEFASAYANLLNHEFKQILNAFFISKIAYDANENDFLAFQVGTVSMLILAHVLIDPLAILDVFHQLTEQKALNIGEFGALIIASILCYYSCLGIAFFASVAGNSATKTKHEHTSVRQELRQALREKRYIYILTPELFVKKIGLPYLRKRKFRQTTFIRSK